MCRVTSLSVSVDLTMSGSQINKHLGSWALVICPCFPSNHFIFNLIQFKILQNCILSLSLPRLRVIRHCPRPAVFECPRIDLNWVLLSSPCPRSAMQDELQTTTRSYESQLSMMSEHLCSMNEKLTAQKDQIDALKLAAKVRRLPS